MNKLILDGQNIGSRHALHALLADGLDFPEDYGCNLDALFDILTELGQDTLIHIRHGRALEQQLGSYASKLFGLLWDASRENPRLRLCLCSDETPLAQP